MCRGGESPSAGESSGEESLGDEKEGDYGNEGSGCCGESGCAGSWREGAVWMWSVDLGGVWDRGEPGGGRSLGTGEVRWREESESGRSLVE